MSKNRRKTFFIIIFTFLFLIGIRPLFHGLPDIERFFAEWNDERLSLNYIMKFGTLNFAPTEIWHPPLYHYLTFIPVASFFIIGKILGFFQNSADFVRFYFFQTQYFFLIGRAMSYLFFWLAAWVIFKTARLFFSRLTAALTALAYVLVPKFIFDSATTRPETLLFLTSALFFYYFLKFYIDNRKPYYLYLAAFLAGLSIATKYNAMLLGLIFLPLPLYYKNTAGNFKSYFKILLIVAFFVFLGFFVGDPFFIIQYKKYFANFLSYNQEIKIYWEGYYPVIFGVTHLKDLASLVYLNPFGAVILFLGFFVSLNKEKRLASLLFFVILAYEIYFGIFQKDCAPLRYLNPLLPFVALLFAGGLEFLRSKKIANRAIVGGFFILLTLNFADIWWAFAQKTTHIQQTRAFIENNLPELSAICIVSDSCLPQLNMTKESYLNLMNTAKDLKKDFHYAKMDDDGRYDSKFRQYRIESLAQKPEYNLIRWDTGISTQQQAYEFFKTKQIAYIVAYGPFFIADKELKQVPFITLVKEFKPVNARVYSSRSVYLYSVNLE